MSQQNKRLIAVNAITLYRAVFHLSWMADTLNFQRELTGIGGAEESEECKDAKELVNELMDLLQDPGHHSMGSEVLS